ncbi:unnamed protein product [Urochloa humidicola]
MSIHPSPLSILSPLLWCSVHSLPEPRWRRRRRGDPTPPLQPHPKGAEAEHPAAISVTLREPPRVTILDVAQRVHPGRVVPSDNLPFLVKLQQARKIQCKELMEGKILQGYDCMVKANGKLEKEVMSLEKYENATQGEG